MKFSALARHPLAIVGAIITTSSAVVFITLTIAVLAGMLTNPYAGLVVFIAIPAAFLFGLVLIPWGMWIERRRLLRDPTAVAEWPVVDFRRTNVRRSALLVVLLTVVNVIIVLLAGYGSLHAMDSPGFCGQTCHTPMHPQFQSWQGGAHAGIACVECHIGEGASAFVHAKLAGVRQLVLVTKDAYARPIPAGTQIPSGEQAEMCRRCHRPERVIGDHVRVIREYADDEANTESITTLQLHMNATSESARAIHWHANRAVHIEYVATDADRQTIPYVRVRYANGQVKEFVAKDAPADAVQRGERRIMECTDCHNSVGHPIMATAEQAVDRAIAAAMVSHDLPYVKRESVRLLKASYESQENASRAIDEGLRTFYRTQGGPVDQGTLNKTVTAVKEIYRRNVFPSMKVTWGTYPDNKGHITSNGCFRCHDDSHTAKDGSAISGDCEFCHKQLETQP
jgi:hypothetical protein